MQNSKNFAALRSCLLQILMLGCSVLPITCTHLRCSFHRHQLQPDQARHSPRVMLCYVMSREVDWPIGVSQGKEFRQSLFRCSTLPRFVVRQRKIICVLWSLFTPEWSFPGNCLLNSNRVYKFILQYLQYQSKLSSETCYPAGTWLVTRVGPHLVILLSRCYTRSRLYSSVILIKSMSVKHLHVWTV